MYLEVDTAETILCAAVEVWLEVTDADVELGVEYLLGRLIAPEQDPEIQRWLAGRLIQSEVGAL